MTNPHYNDDNDVAKTIILVRFVIINNFVIGTNFVFEANSIRIFFIFVDLDENDATDQEILYDDNSETKIDFRTFLINRENTSEVFIRKVREIN